MADNFTPLNNQGQQKNAAISHGPETEPIGSIRPSESSQIQEVVEHDIQDEDVKGHVEVVKEVPEIPIEVENAGITASQTTQFPSFKDLQLPESDEKIIDGLHKPVNTSARWLAVLCLYLLNRAHLTLKSVKGKVVRVTKK